MYNNTTKEGDWWNPNIKTIYDPCPIGYKIPEKDTYGKGSNVTTHPDWSVWSEGGLKSGRIFKNSSFFPTSGRRIDVAGQFSDIGQGGRSWMSMPSSTTHST